MPNFIFFTERQYLDRIKANDRSVLGEIFIRYRSMIYNYIMNHAGSEFDAQDILQEVIIVLWQKVNSGKFLLSSKLGTYLMGIAKNKWRAELRKRKRLNSEQNYDSFADGNPSSLELLLTEEKVRLVQKALDSIKPLCKKLLMLFYFEEKSMNEIAQLMNFANVDVAKSKKYQCKKALETSLQNYLAKVEGDTE